MPVAGVTVGPTTKTPYIDLVNHTNTKREGGPIEVSATAGKVIIEQLAVGFRPIQTNYQPPH